jgi:hypothetical protein
VPKRLGEGAFDRMYRSAATACAADSLSGLVCRPTHREETIAAFERLTARFAQLAITTRTARDLATSESALPHGVNTAY